MRYYRWSINVSDGCRGERPDCAIADALAQIDLHDLAAYVILEEITEDEYRQTDTGIQDPFL